jgi:SET domain-containing protein
MKYKVSKSKIPNADKGLFAKNQIRQGERIGLAHKQGQPVGTLGNMHNHSDEPNMHSVKVGDKRYVYAKRDIKPGEELTTNYRMQPELEQPEDFMRKGGRTRGLVQMPKPSKKGLASKKYSRSLEATNILFAQNPLFKKPKSKRNKIFNPNAKYYQGGGYVDLELDDTQIAQYVKGGYIVEELD